MQNNDDESEIEYLTREQVIARSRQETSRDIIESDSMISYTAFVPQFEDFCHCEFRLVLPHGWVGSIRVLRADERRADEQITDVGICEVARAGRLIPAIRLYRAKYGVGLADAKAHVDELMKRDL